MDRGGVLLGVLIALALITTPPWVVVLSLLAFCVIVICNKEGEGRA